jgi:hypothetical protein
MTTLLLTAVLLFAASWAASGPMTGWLRRQIILDHPIERSYPKAAVSPPQSLAPLRQNCGRTNLP